MIKLFAKEDWVPPFADNPFRAGPAQLRVGPLESLIIKGRMLGFSSFIPAYGPTLATIPIPPYARFASPRLRSLHPGYSLLRFIQSTLCGLGKIMPRVNLQASTELVQQPYCFMIKRETSWLLILIVVPNDADPARNGTSILFSYQRIEPFVMQEKRFYVIPGMIRSSHPGCFPYLKTGNQVRTNLCPTPTNLLPVAIFYCPVSLPTHHGD